MSYFLPTVLISAVGLSTELARLLTAVNSVTYLILACASVTLVERWGRRGLMLLSTAGQGFSFLIITILLRYGGPGGNPKAAEGSIVFFFLYFTGSYGTHPALIIQLLSWERFPGPGTWSEVLRDFEECTALSNQLCERLSSVPSPFQIV